jgi:hypothetical protein
MTIINIIATVFIAIFTGLLYRATRELAKISEKQVDTLKEQTDISSQQAKILHKQTEIQNSQFEPDVDILKFKLRIDIDYAMSFLLFMRNNSHASIIVKEISVNAPYTKTVEYPTSSLNKNIKVANGLLKVRVVIPSRRLSQENNLFSQKVNLYFEKPIQELSNEMISVKVTYVAMRANVKDESIIFVFKIKDVLDYFNYKKNKKEALDYTIPLKITKQE